MLQLVNLSKDYSGRVLFANISWHLRKGERVALIGENGAGKSTLMKIIAGLEESSNGDIQLAKGARAAYLPQDGIVSSGRMLFHEARSALSELLVLEEELHRLGQELEQMPHDAAGHDALLARYGELQEQFRHRGGYTMEAEIGTVLKGLGFSQEDWHKDCGEFSGGWQMRIALARLLLQKPDVLLLDEPTNHLDAETVAWLEKHLHSYSGTVIAVTHDRYFLDNVAGWILELDRGEGIPWKGNYSSWLEQKQGRLAVEEKQESERQKTLKRELEWIRMSPKGRHTKAQARISKYEDLAAQEGEARGKDLELYIPAGPRLGDIVIEADNVSKGFGDRLLYEGMTFKLPRGGIVGVIGPNGAGKTTLFRMITGTETPDSGTIRIGDTVQVAYVDQSRDSLNPDRLLWEEISDGQEMIQLGRQTVNARNYVARFNFTGGDQQKKVGMLSGGERNRVHLAKVLKSGANVLLLDEPTNDLDVNTMRALEEGLENFGGCAVVISHDRWFLDRIATHILAFEGDSKVTWFEGNYSEYEEDRRKRLGSEADRPHRITYRKLTR